jgi:propionyl-CoA carboxylase alpha chain
MNTRLQVEHPVTEMITGLDLVEQMIRVAAGEQLAVHPGRAEARMAGPSSARINAEDPVARLPAVGRPPDPATGRRRSPSASVRVDTGVFEGGEISMYYDSMIAKLICYGGTRDQAVMRVCATRSTPSSSAASTRTSRSRRR